MKRKDIQTELDVLSHDVNYLNNFSKVLRDSKKDIIREFGKDYYDKLCIITANRMESLFYKFMKDE